MGSYLVHDSLIDGMKIEKCPSPINEHGLTPGPQECATLYGTRVT